MLGVLCVLSVSVFVVAVVRCAGQVPSLDELSSEWQEVVVCNAKAGALQACGANPFDHSHNLTFLLSLDQASPRPGCCYDADTGFSFAPNNLTANATAQAASFYGADQAIPSLSNTLGSLHSEWSGGVGVTCVTFPPLGGPCEGWPGYHNTTPFPSRVTLDNAEIALSAAAHRFKWTAYEIQHKHTLISNSQVVTSQVRMGFAAPTVFVRLSGQQSSRAQSLQMDLTAFGRDFRDSVWGSPANDALFDAGCFRSQLISGTDRDDVSVVLVSDCNSTAVSAVALSPPPHLELVPSGSGTVYRATFELAPGSPWALGLVWVMQQDGDVDEAVAAATAVSGKHFDAAFASAKADWEGWWASAFVPPEARAAPHGPVRAHRNLFSGNLPTLTTDHKGLSRLYYASLLSMLNVVHRPFAFPAKGPYAPPNNTLSFSAISPVAAQSMMYMWDSGYVALPWSLLDGAGFKSALEVLLGGLGNDTQRNTTGLHSHSAVDTLSGTGIGDWYAFNDYSFVIAADTWMRLNGRDAQNTTLHGRPMLEWVEYAATFWQSRTGTSRRSPWLADYGTNDNLLEVAPLYAHVVPSLNAANSWMLRCLGDYVERSNATRAAQLREWADRIQNATVRELYVQGEGYWACEQPDGTLVPVRHILDVVNIVHALDDQLPSEVRSEMLSFAESELRAPEWFRALSLADPTASWASTQRDDHGPFGAWDGWVAKMVEVYGLVGEWDKALEVVEMGAAAFQEGPFGQSHHVFMPNNTWAPRTMHKSGDWLVGEYFALCGGMFANYILSTLFGIQPQRNGQGAVAQADLLRPTESRGFVGTLHNVRVRGQLVSLVSDEAGLHWKDEAREPAR